MENTLCTSGKLFYRPWYILYGEGERADLQRGMAVIMWSYSGNRPLVSIGYTYIVFPHFQCFCLVKQMATFHIWSDSLTKWQMDKSDYLTPLCACADRVTFLYQGPNKFHGKYCVAMEVSGINNLTHCCKVPELGTIAYFNTHWSATLSL